MFALPMNLEADPWTALRREADTLRLLADHVAAKGDPALQARVRAALEAGACPRCAEAQADGVPCAGTVSSCDRCVRALDWVRNLRLDLERTLARQQDPGPAR